MLISDESCRSDITFKRHIESGIFDIVQPDWVGLIVMSSALRCTVDGFLSFSHLSNDTVLGSLQPFAAGIQADFFPKIFESNGIHMVMLPVRCAEKYLVFYLYCKETGCFSERDFLWMKTYTKMSYAITLLSNEVGQDRNYIENVLNSTSSAIMAFDLDGNVVTVNDAVASIFNMTKQNFTGKHYFEYIREESRDAFIEAFSSVVRTEEKRSLKNVLFANQDNNHILNIVLSPLIDGKNQLIGIVLVGTDITELRLMEMEVEQVKQFSMMGDMAMGLVHDIKNPLTNICGYTRLLVRRETLDEQQTDMLNIILHEADRINTVLEQMLSYGNITHKNSSSYVNINEIIITCIQIIKRQWILKEITISSRLANDLPIIQADSFYIQQALINVMINSVQAIEQTGKIEIISKYMANEKTIRITIEDNGIGISEQDLSQLCTPYFTTKARGTGLGLFWAKRILERSNATLCFSSMQGCGTKACIDFAV